MQHQSRGSSTPVLFFGTRKTCEKDALATYWRANKTLSREIISKHTSQNRKHQNATSRVSFYSGNTTSSTVPGRKLRVHMHVKSKVGTRSMYNVRFGDVKLFYSSSVTVAGMPYVVDIQAERRWARWQCNPNGLNAAIIARSFDAIQSKQRGHADREPPVRSGAALFGTRPEGDPIPPRGNGHGNTSFAQESNTIAHLPSFSFNTPSAASIRIR